MINRTGALLLAALLPGLLLSACGEKSEPEIAAGPDQAPALSAEAGRQAIEMINGDLNRPLADVQAMLAAAAADGDIAPGELVVSTPEGSIPLDWWVWNKGFLSLADDPDYGPYLILSDKGRRFLQMDASAWLTAALVGAPRMQCQAAGSATSAACTAIVTYATTAGRNADLGTISVPQANADLEAAFAPGQGWSVVRLSAEGDTPAVLVRHALFGTPEARDAARIQYQTSLRAAVDRLAQAAAPPPPSPASGAGERLPAVRDPKLEAASAPPPAGRAQPVRVTNPAYARRPTNEELAGLYPERALDGNVSGQSTMTCTVGVSGQLSACVSASETPRGYRFGQAGVEAARYFRMTPRTEDGRAVESRVNISINWTL